MATTFDPGHYRARVAAWAMLKAKTGTPQFALSFLPIGKFNAQNPDADFEPCPDVERTIFRPITDKTAGWVLRDLKTLFEYPHDRFGPLDPDSPEAFDFHDREFTAVLTYEEYEGKTRERWNFASGAAALNGDPLTAVEIRKLDTLFGAAKPKRNGRKPTPPPAEPQAAVTAAAESRAS